MSTQPALAMGVLFALLAPHPIAAQEPADAPLYRAVDGVFVVEAEDAEPASDWQRVEDASAAGDAFLHYRGANQYEFDGDYSGMRYCLDIAQPGEYQLRIRMQRSRAGEPDIREDERNDLWLRMDGRHLMKLFANTAWEEWGWDGGLDFHHYNGKRPRASLVFENVGVSCFEIAGRSEDVRLDRIQLTLDGESQVGSLSSTLVE